MHFLPLHNPYILGKGDCIMIKRRWLLLLTTLLLAGFSCFSAWAEEVGDVEKDTAITHVTLEFSWDKAPKGGSLVGHVYASSPDTEFKIEGADYIKQDDTWIFGERPLVEVSLSAKSGYYFSELDPEDFYLSGCSARYKSAETDSDSAYLTLYVYFNKIDGSLPATTAASWSGTSASWDEVGGSRGYNVKLYRDNILLATISTTAISYDFAPYINNEGIYTFKIQPIGYYRTQAGPWVDSEDNYTMTEEEACFSDNGTWSKTSKGRRFLYKNGAYPSDSWRYIGEKWYYFDSDGYMVSKCYVKSPGEGLYCWIGADGAWDHKKDTAEPNRSKYTIYY